MIKPEVLQYFKGKRCLVTGSAGMIGQQVVDILRSADAKVRTFDYRNGQDLRQLTECMIATHGEDCVFHIAGLKGSIVETTKRPADFFVPMLQMNTNILEAARRNEVPQLVYTSSIGAYPDRKILVEAEGYNGEPMDFYPGWAKRMGEFQLQAYRLQYGLNYSCVRLASVYGPGDTFSKEAMVIPALLWRIQQGEGTTAEKPLRVWGDGSAIRDFVYCRDVAEGIILALYHGTGDGFLNLGSGEGWSIMSLVEVMAKVTGMSYWSFDVAKPTGQSCRVLDIDQAKKLLHYNPKTSLVEGLKKTWEWLKPVEEIPPA